MSSFTFFFLSSLLLFPFSLYTSFRRVWYSVRLFHPLSDAKLRIEDRIVAFCLGFVKHPTPKPTDWHSSSNSQTYRLALNNIMIWLSLFISFEIVAWMAFIFFASMFLAYIFLSLKPSSTLLFVSSVSLFFAMIQIMCCDRRCGGHNFSEFAC